MTASEGTAEQVATGESGGDLTGRLLGGRYRVIGQIGKGGMGVVCRATDEVLGREVAVKILRAYSDASAPELADLRTRMQREARAAARIRHSGVITVHDVTDEDGRPVIVMELVDGPSLDDVLSENGALEPRRAAEIGAKVADALDAGHRAGVLHRDVKPGNVLLDRSGRVVLTDFGIASIEAPGDGADTRLTRSGELVGSLDYLPPERAQGQEPSPASDVWSLGMTLYAAVEESSPFRRESVWLTLNAIVSEELPEPRRAGPLAPVLRQMMHKDPAHRPSAARARELLEAVAAANEPRAATPAAPPPAPAGGGAVPYVRPAPSQPETPSEHGGFGSASTAPLPRPRQQPYEPVPLVSRQTRPGPQVPAGSRDRGRLVLASVAAAVVLIGGGVAYVFASGSGSRSTPSDAAGPSVNLPVLGGTASGAPAGKGKPSVRPESSPSESGAPQHSAVPSGGTTDEGGKGTPRPSKPHPAPTTAHPAPPPAAPVCDSIGGGKYNCHTWRQANSYTQGGTPEGVLHAGTNYFFCQANLGRRETYGSWTNVWWAKTDDDSGNSGVWVSDVYITGGNNDQPVPGLPVC